MNDIKSILNNLKKGGTKTIQDLQRLVNNNNLYMKFLDEIYIGYNGLNEVDKKVFVIVTGDNYIVGIGNDKELDNLFAEVRRKIDDIENGVFKSIGQLRIEKYEN